MDRWLSFPSSSSPPPPPPPRGRREVAVDEGGTVAASAGDAGGAGEHVGVVEISPARTAQFVALWAVENRPPSRGLEAYGALQVTEHGLCSFFCPLLVERPIHTA